MSRRIASSDLNVLKIQVAHIFWLIILIYELLFNQNVLAVTVENLSGNDHKIFDFNNANNRIFRIGPGNNGSLTLTAGTLTAGTFTSGTLPSGTFDSRDDNAAQQYPLISINDTVNVTNFLQNYTINIASRAISSNQTPVIDVNNSELLGVVNIVNGYVNNSHQIYPEGSYIYRTLLSADDPNPRPINYGPVIDFLKSGAKLNLIQNQADNNKIHGNIRGSNNGDTIVLNGGFVYGSLLLGNAANTVTLANNAYLEASKEMLSNEAAIIGGTNQNTINVTDNSKIVAGKGKDAISINSANLSSTINITGQPEINGSITAINSSNHALNIGNNEKAAIYSTYADINNIDNIELNNPINNNTILTNNHNITGVKSFVVRYNATAKTDNGSIKAFVPNATQGTTNVSTITNYGDFIVNNAGLVYGFSIDNKGSMNINNSSSVLFSTSFNNSADLSIQDKADLSTIENNKSTLVNNLNKNITIDQYATIGKFGALGPINNYGNIVVKGNIYADSLINQANANVVLYGNANVNLEGTNATSSGILTNNGNLFIPSNAIINASKIIQGKNLTIEGTVNASIQLSTQGSIIQVLGGKFKDISATMTGNILEILGPAFTNGDLQKIDTIKIMQNNFVVNNNINQINNSFTTYPHTITEIGANGDVSGGGEINNLGTIMLQKQNNVGGTIGAANGVNKFHNKGSFIAGGGDVNVTAFDNNSIDAIFQINSGNVLVNSLNNISGKVEINGGELSLLSGSTTAGSAGTANTSNAGKLINNNDQVITVMNQGKIGDINPFDSINNYGIFNILGQSVVKINSLVNDHILNNLNTQVQLNIYAQLLVGTNNSSTTGAVTGSGSSNTIDNKFGTINISSTENDYGDLSSNNPSALTMLNNYYNQRIEVHNQGTIGKIAALGEIVNNGEFLANGGDIIVGNFTNGDSNNHYPGKLIINRGIFKAGEIINNLGSIDILQAINILNGDQDGNISGDLSSSHQEQRSNLTNHASQIINVQTGTIGKHIPIGTVNNSGIINVNNDIKVGDFNNLYSSILNVSGGISLVGNINNQGNINIVNSGGSVADLSSIDPEHPSTLTNSASMIINILNQGTIGVNNRLGDVNNQGTINANGGNIIIGNLAQGVYTNSNSNQKVVLNINSGRVVVGNIENNKGNSIIIKNADLSSFSQEMHSQLINRGGTIDVELNGTIGMTSNYSGLGTVSNYDNGSFIANGQTIKIDNFENGYKDVSVLNTSQTSPSGNLIIQNGNVLVGQMSNYNGTITIGPGDLSSQPIDITNYSSILNNYASQKIIINNLGSIGKMQRFKSIINNGDFTFAGDSVLATNFVNNSNLNITKGLMQIGETFNNFGILNIGPDNNTGGDLSSIEANSLNLINGQINDINNLAIINVNNLGTIGKDECLGEITNFGNIEANTTTFKSGNINNYKYLKIIDNSATRLVSGLQEYSVKLGKINNYDRMILDSNNKINQIFVNKITNTNGGILDLNHDIVINGGLINEVKSTINLAGNLTVTNDLNANEVFINNGIINFAQPIKLNQGNYILGTTGTHKVLIVDENPATLTLVDAGSSVTIMPGAHIYIDYLGKDFIKDQQVFTIISSNTFNLPNLNRILVNGSTLLVDYNPILKNSNHDLSIVATRKSIKSFIDPQHSYMLELAGSLDNLIAQKADTDLTLKGALQILEDLPSKEKLVESVSQLIPDLDLPEITLASNNFIVAEATAERIEVLARSGFPNNATGYSAGNMYGSDNGIWIKGLIGNIKQGPRDNFAGYNATTGGVVIGADTKFLDNLWFGLGFSNVHTLMRSKDFPSKRIILDSYQVTAYGSFSPKNYYIDSFASLALNNYKTKREILFAIPNQIATAKFKGVQPAFKFAAGYIFDLLGIRIIPNLSLQYSVLYQNPYNEEPVNIIGLQKISSDQLKQLEAGVGVKLGIMDDGGSDSTYNYEVRMMLLNDFQANPRVTTAEFVGGGGSFKIPGITPDRITYNLGTGIVFKYKDSLHFTVNYDLRIKNKFIGHAGAIAVRYVL